jgi:flagellin
MRIEKNLNNQLAQKYSKTAKDNSKVMEQLATGKKINRASDDAAMISVAREFEKQIRAYRGAADNIDYGSDALSIADGSAGSINEMLQRQQELAVQSANGAYGQDQRDALDKEFQSLSQEIDRISKSTEFSGQKLLDGTGPLSDGTGSIQSGPDAGDSITLTTADLTVGALGTGSESLKDPVSALKAMGSIDAAMRKVADTRASQGSLVNRLGYADASSQSQQINLTQGLSNVEDLDYAQALTDKVRNDILQNSQASAISQFNQLSKTHILALLQ